MVGQEKDGRCSRRDVKSKPSRQVPMLSMQSLAKRPNRRRVEKRQTDNACLTTVYRNGMRGDKCEGAQSTYTQKVQDTEQVTKKDA